MEVAVEFVESLVVAFAVEFVSDDFALVSVAVELVVALESDVSVESVVSAVSVDVFESEVSVESLAVEVELFELY